ncbi:hypothetical protein HMPREF2932_09285 [Corynebacterium sp. HMSC074H12]|nr:hypothetical protein HMPREF2932_09285 [Corynebacterium sp. HMSC074H12]
MMALVRRAVDLRLDFHSLEFGRTVAADFTHGGLDPPAVCVNTHERVTSKVVASPGVQGVAGSPYHILDGAIGNLDGEQRLRLIRCFE